MPRSIPIIPIAAVVLLVAAGLAAFEYHATRSAEADGLRRRAGLLQDQLVQARFDSEKLREDRDAIAIRLAEAAAALDALTEAAADNPSRHDLLRAEIARLSEENIRLEALGDGQRAQVQAARQTQAQAENAWRDTRTALATASNQVDRLTAAEKSARDTLAARDRDLAAARADIAAAQAAAREAQAQAKTLETRLAQAEAARKTSADQAEAARKISADQAAAAQTRAQAAAAELQALKTRVAQLEADLKKAAPPAAPNP